MVSAATAAAVAEVVDLERLLWVPGAKTIFVPTPTPQGLALSAEMLKALSAANQNLFNPPCPRAAIRFLSPEDQLVTRRYVAPEGNVVARLPQRIVNNAELGIAIRFIKQWQIDPPAWEYRHG